MGEGEEERHTKLLIFNHLNILWKGEIKGDLDVIMKMIISTLYCFSLHNINLAYSFQVMPSLS